MLTAAVLAAGLALVLAALLSSSPAPTRLVPRTDIGGDDPLAFRPGEEHALEQAAAAGLSHVLYVKSPGGIVAAATRTARFRPKIDAAVAGTGIAPDLLEALVFLESAGRPEVIAGSDPAAAAGLTQIVAQTGSGFLGMRIDLAASRRLTRAIARASERGDRRAVARLERRRRQVDPRFDPAAALAASVRYLSFARRYFGRDDLAFTSYHMGIGNLADVARAYAGAPGARDVAALVRRDDLSYARLYFDSSPIRHAAAWQRLARLGDDSRNYYWKLLAAREVMRLFRSDRGRLVELSRLHRLEPSAAAVLHPPDTTDQFADPGALTRAWLSGVLQQLPAEPGPFHLAVDPSLGSLASKVGEPPELYRGLRADALALLLYLVDRVHAIGRVAAPLAIAEAADDRAYRELAAGSSDAVPAYALSTTGWSFAILRRYAAPAQAAAFQFELDRLQARDLIAWSRSPTLIHVTVSTAAARLVPAMLRRAS